ncbi:undecaprenyl diphosphate synthase family protein [Streptomyces sp. MS1.AVA.1]|uniref:Undecaprenyl diphosphate synthase family protein n=1 Tax=Streptomyces machairae TaxID=3134109 RepID=A0ABU8UUR0_9ACTN
MPAGPRTIVGDVFRRGGIHDPLLRRGFEVCRRATRDTGEIEYATSLLLPPPLRLATWALYGAVRAVDDLADATDGSAEDRARRLEAWISAFDADLRDGRSTDPVRHALIHTTQTWNLSTAFLHTLFEELRQDVHGREFATWQEWRRYSSLINTPLVLRTASLLIRAAGLPLEPETMAARRARSGGGLAVGGGRHLPHRRPRGPGPRPHPWPRSAPGRGTGGSRGTPRRPVRPAPHPGLRADGAPTHRPGPSVVRPGGPAAGAASGGGHCPGHLPRPVPAAARHGGQRPRSTAAPAARPALAAASQVARPARAKAALAWSLFPFPLRPSPASETGEPPPTGSRQSLAQAVRSVGEQQRPLAEPDPHPSGARPPQLPADATPRHVAIIMDGNGRWATDRGLPRTEGHRAGAEALIDVVHGALEIGLSHLTVYMFSTENWKRPADELQALMREIPAGLRRLYDGTSPLDVRVRWAGVPTGLPPTSSKPSPKPSGRPAPAPA